MVQFSLNFANPVKANIYEKTGTMVTRVLNKDGKTISKTVIPGPGNKVSCDTSSFVTSYVNGKPQIISGTKTFGTDKDVAMIFKKEHGKGFKSIDVVM